MASRISEVIYKLRDLFTQPAERIKGQYKTLRRESKRTASSIDADTDRLGAAFIRLTGAAKAGLGAFFAALSARRALSEVGQIADELDRLGKTADRLDIDPNTLSALEFAAERSGVAVEKMTASIATLQKRTGEAAAGLGVSRKAFEALGISVEDFIELDAEQQLILIAEAIQGIGSEEQRAAIAAQLFSKANSEMLQILNQGSVSLKNLIDRGKEYRDITREQTDAAAAYNDALSNLSRKTDAIKFEFATPVIQYLNRTFEQLGVGADEAANLATQLEVAEARLAGLSKYASKGSAAFVEAAQRVDELRAALKALQDAEKAEQEAARAAEAERQRQVAATKAYRETLDGLTDDYKERVKTREQALKQETDDLRKARAEQAAIEKEFSGLVDSIAAPADTEVGLIDVFGKIREAAAAASDEQSDRAIELARQGGGLLERLKDAGSESDLVLQFLAKRLQSIAREASDQKVEAELVDAEQAKAALDGVKNKFDALSSDAATSGSAVGRAFVDALQVELSKTTLQLPALQPVNVAPIVADAINSYNEQLEKTGRK